MRGWRAAPRRFAAACPGRPDKAKSLGRRATSAVKHSSSIRELAGNPLIP
ncbi:hypothetical protein AB0M39_10335 [Streptomyces sp. NPDC051907]